MVVPVGARVGYRRIYSKARWRKPPGFFLALPRLRASPPSGTITANTSPHLMEAVTMPARTTRFLAAFLALLTALSAVPQRARADEPKPDLRDKVNHLVGQLGESDSEKQA